ncbi:MAG: PAC2 family protein, partial [Chloroflexota bacterium]
IGEIKDDGYYIFQIPGTHHLMRPVVNLGEGQRKSLEKPVNEIYFTGDEEKGLVIFTGDEPHLNIERYGEAFFGLVKELEIERVAVVAGVYGSMPYDRDREIGCIFSLDRMRTELDRYAVRYSNYQGGASIGTFLLDQATEKEIEYFGFYGFSPAYQFPTDSESQNPQGLRVEHDYKAWYDILVRLEHMFKFGFNLNELHQESQNLIDMLDGKVAELEQELPQLNLRDYFASLDAEFTERSFFPLDDVWSSGLDDLFDEGPAE